MRHDSGWGRKSVPWFLGSFVLLFVGPGTHQNLSCVGSAGVCRGRRPTVLLGVVDP
ncbi:hypothetical protein KC19_1G088800 [Ceratodon purpureus]|uniref:Uncharacterized protein n=1 Tax=Ceratodon purpureus TaxID=3225 RepID=A0A8T0J315_CERPU|nr:hypothetical protein KC19_1G088800 [Ceratodon purpureus]